MTGAQAAAVFTLLIGGGDIRYLALYTGILLVGAAVATLITLATPGQPLVQARSGWSSCGTA